MHVGNDWKLADWNHALFEEVFRTRKGLRQGPVRRIVDPRGLLTRCRVGNHQISDSEQESCVRAFEACFPRDEREFRKLLTVNGYDLHVSGAAPWFAALFLTLLPADDLDEGDFRRRLADLRGAPAGTRYSLEGLARLWEALVEQLAKLRGQPLGSERYRALVLPDPGPDTLIGYSKRLVFPTHRDLGKLSRVVCKARLSEQTPILKVISTLKEHRKSFSRSFLGELEDFEQVYRSQVVFNPQTLASHPIWTAFREACGQSLDDGIASRLGSTRQASDIELSLDLTRPRNPQLAVLCEESDTSSAVQLDRYGLMLTELSDVSGIYRFEIQTERSDEALTEKLIEAMLASEAFFQNTHFCESLGEHGVIAFIRDWDSGRWVARPTIGSDERAYLAYYKPRAYKFEDVVRQEGGFDGRCVESRCQWVRDFFFVGPLSPEEVELFRRAAPEAPIFGRAMPGSGIVLHNAVKTKADGVLLNSVCLPRIEAEGADRLVLESMDAERHYGSFSLRANPTQSERGARIPEALLDRLDLPSEFNLLALEGDVVLATKALRFTDRITVTKLKQPNFWYFEVESPNGDLGDVQVPEEQTVLSSDALAGRTSIAELPSEARWSATSPFTRVTTEGTEAPRIDQVELDGLPVCWSDLFEVLAARGSRRAQLDYDDVSAPIGLLARQYGDTSKRVVGAIVRALIENGHLYELFRCAWAGRVFNVRRPTLTMSDEEPTWGLVEGVTTAYQRSELLKCARELNLTLKLHLIGTWEVPGSIRVRGSSSDELREFAEAIKAIGITSAISMAQPMLAMPERIIERAGGPLTQRRDVLRRRYFDFEHGSFPNTEPSLARRKRLGVTLTWEQAVGSQDRYEVFVEDERVFKSGSRYWAVLVALRLSNTNAWSVSDNGCVMSLAPYALPLPLPMSQGAAVGRECLSGPSLRKDGSLAHSYSFEDIEHAQSMLGVWLVAKGAVPSGHSQASAISHWLQSWGAPDWSPSQNRVLREILERRYEYNESTNEV